MILNEQKNAINDLEKLPDEIHAKLLGRLLPVIETILQDTDSRLIPTKKSVHQHISAVVNYTYKTVMNSLNMIDNGERVIEKVK